MVEIKYALGELAESNFL